MAADFEMVGPLGLIPDGGTRLVAVGTRDVLLSRFGQEVFAVGGDCTHAFASLIDGRVEGRTVTCAAHGARFDLTTGRSLSRTCPDLPRYAVKVEGGKVFVARARS